MLVKLDATARADKARFPQHADRPLAFISAPIEVALEFSEPGAFVLGPESG